MSTGLHPLKDEDEAWTLWGRENPEAEDEKDMTRHGREGIGLRERRLGASVVLLLQQRG